MPTADQLTRIVRLLSRDERSTLGSRVCGDEAAPLEVIVKELSLLPRYEAVRATLRASQSTLRLLHEVCGSISRFCVSVRTTGLIIVLADTSLPGERCELLLSPQLVQLLSDFAGLEDLGGAPEPGDLARRWYEFRDTWIHLLQRSRPRKLRGDLDVISSFLEKRVVYERDRDITHRSSRKALRYYSWRVSRLLTKLDAHKGESPPPLRTIQQEARHLIDEATDTLDSYRKSRDEKDKFEEWLQDRDEVSAVLEREVGIKFMSDFDRFAEDWLSLGRLAAASELIDLLAVNLWSGRPQLYEVWVLTQILDKLLANGYVVELRGLTFPSRQTEPRWELSYAKAARPCAAISANGAMAGFLFYQLYQPSGDMPDIAFFKTDDPNSKAIWSIDAKHSEREGYSYSDYRNTARRYHDSFGANTSIVVEYFDRANLCEANPERFEEGGFLIRGCRPGGPGQPLLLAALEELHPTLAAKSLLCVDVSSSFSHRLPAALEVWRSTVPTGGYRERYVKEVLVFAGGSSAMQGELERILDGATPNNGGLADGTLAAPLFECVAKLVANRGCAHVVLITDGGFSDDSLQHLCARLSDELGVRPEVIR